MSNYIIFRASDGEILRTGYCPPEMLFKQTNDGECIIEGIANDVLHEVDINTIEIKKKKEKPDPYKEKREKEQMIQKRMDKILRDMAIAQLKAEGHDVK
jgi:hypothetical protein